MKRHFIHFATFGSQSLIYVSCIVVIGMLTSCGEKKDSTSRRKAGETTALALITKNDCLNCHSIRDKSVGPSYEMIAQRYESDEATVDQLADKIISGGGGLWGGAVMTKHPYLKKSNAAEIVRWILSLDDSTANQDPMFHTEGMKLAQAFDEGKGRQRKKNGLTLKAYSLEGFGEYRTAFPDVAQDMMPTHAGVVDKIHFPNSQAFAPLSKDFVLQATGFIHIKAGGKYFFRQVKAGKGRLFIDGSKKINESDWDSEIVVDLSPGVYPIVVDYQSGGRNERLSLQWITPDAEYYEVIPEDVFTCN